MPTLPRHESRATPKRAGYCRDYSIAVFAFSYRGAGSCAPISASLASEYSIHAYAMPRQALARSAGEGRAPSAGPGIALACPAPLTLISQLPVHTRKSRKLRFSIGIFFPLLIGKLINSYMP